MNISWSNSYLKTFVIFRELGQDLLHASHLKEEPKKKNKYWTTFVFSPPKFLFMISLPCGSDLLLLQHLLSSLPFTDWRKLRHKKPDKLLTQFLACVVSRNAPERQSLQRRAWRGIGLYMTQFILFPCYVLLWTHNSKLKGKNQRGEKRNK